MLSVCYSYNILMKLTFSRKIFETYLNIKYYENPSSGSRVAPCGRTDMTKLIVAFHNYANAAKYSAFCPDGVCVCVCVCLL
jgi:hypothetical protein